MTVHGVLLIPGPGHEGLLEEGPCGARPPMAWRAQGVLRSWHAGRAMPGEERALVLAWEGKPVRAAMDLAFRAAWDGDFDRSALDGHFVAAARAWDIGTIVLLDSEGQEVER
jgi:hypothetical protein